MTTIRSRFVIIFAIALALVLVPIVAHASPTPAVLNFPGEVDCATVYPDHPIKGMTYDARSGAVSTQCYTQEYWDMNLIGGKVFEDYQAALSLGQTFDAATIIADWKSEKVAIEALRVDAEVRAQTGADASPGDVVCKAWSYTSIYNGSGGGSVCKVNNSPVDVSVKRSTATSVTSATSAEHTTSATPLAARYFAKTASTPKLTGAKLKFTLPRAPKGTKLNVFKSAASSCNLKGRVVKSAGVGVCELTLTITRHGALLGTQTLTLTSR
jgi:hypothetical protein